MITGTPIEHQGAAEFVALLVGTLPVAALFTLMIAGRLERPSRLRHQ